MNINIHITHIHRNEHILYKSRYHTQYNLLLFAYKSLLGQTFIQFVYFVQHIIDRYNVHMYSYMNDIS